MTYNMTLLQGSTTVFELIEYANDSTGQILMGLFMLSIFFIMLFVLKKWEMDTALIVSSYVCFILSGMLSYAKLLNFLFPIGFLCIAGFMTLYVYMMKT